MFSFKKKKRINIVTTDDDITALADAKMINIETVNDSAFSEKLLGYGVAFELHGDTIVSPCNGLLNMVFETGHACTITMNNGIELLIHIGIDTVRSEGKGFKILCKQGSLVKAGDPLIKVNLPLLQKNYDMTTMLIVVEDNGRVIEFIDYGEVKMGQKINI